MTKHSPQLKNALDFHKRGLLSEADAIYRKIIKKNQRDFYALYLSGLVAHDMGRFSEAEGLFMRACDVKNSFDELHYWLGRTFLAQSKRADAIKSFERATQLNPEYADAWFWSGSAFLEELRYDDACVNLEKAIALNPSSAESIAQRGIALREKGHYSLARLEFEKAISVKPHFPEAFLNYGIVFQLEGRHQASIPLFEKAISFKHGYSEAYCNLGLAYEKLMLLDRAIENYNRAIKSNPLLATAFANRANALQRLMRFEEAKSDLISAISLNNQYAVALSNLSHLLLLTGELQTGFELLEWRNHNQVSVGHRTFQKPLWLGAENLQNKTIMIHEEQGIGDVIQFSRYLNLLEAEEARVIFAVRSKLLNLIRSAFPRIEVCSIEEITQDFDFHCPLMSLPLALRTDLSSIPAQTPYLSCDSNLSKRLRDNLSEGGQKKVCGVSWRTAAKANGASRSVNLQDLFSVIDPSGYHFVNLQYGDVAAEIADLKNKKGIHLSNVTEVDNFNDIDGFAALVEACDIVLSIDNFTVHLAGALHKKTFVMLPQLPDWRWMLHRQDSPWYPSLRLFRQDSLDSWDGVFQNIRDALSRSLFEEK